MRDLLIKTSEINFGHKLSDRVQKLKIYIDEMNFDSLISTIIVKFNVEWEIKSDFPYDQVMRIYEK